MKKYYNQYIITGVNSASQHDLLIMLYDAAIQSMLQSVHAINNNDFIRATKMNSRTLDIMVELIDSLNFDSKLHLVKKLYNLYLHITREVLLAHIEEKPERIEESIRIMRILKESWMQIRRNKSTAPADSLSNEMEQTSKSQILQNSPSSDSTPDGKTEKS